MDSTDYSLQDLLDFLEASESEKVPDLPFTSELEEFISTFKIRNGVDRITNHMIYYTYKEKFGGELSKIQFFREFKKLFIQRRTGTQRVYLLDVSSFDMSEDGLLEAAFHNKGKKKVD